MPSFLSVPVSPLVRRACRILGGWALIAAISAPNLEGASPPVRLSFKIEEATIASLQPAILAHQVTATDVVKMYLARSKAYNGPAVEQPYGILGPIKTIPHARGAELRLPPPDFGPVKPSEQTASQ